jgi:hypothetical protein
MLGLVGGFAFEMLRTGIGLERHDTAYALLAMPVYAALATLNLAMVAIHHPGIASRERLRIFSDTGVPTAPLELLSGVMAGAVALVWGHVGILAAGALLGLLIITTHSCVRSATLSRRHVSDERAAEVARLASDRERLLSELFAVEQRERGRLAESLHDAPMQRLVAIRQDTAEREGEGWKAVAGHLEQAISETRAIISAFHPATFASSGSRLRFARLWLRFPPLRGSRCTSTANSTAVSHRHAAAARGSGTRRKRSQACEPGPHRHGGPGRRQTCGTRGQRRRRRHRYLRCAAHGPGGSHRSCHGPVACRGCGRRAGHPDRPDGGTRSRVTLPIELTA